MPEPTASVALAPAALPVVPKTHQPKPAITERGCVPPASQKNSIQLDLGQTATLLREPRPHLLALLPKLWRASHRLELIPSPRAVFLCLDQLAF
jgi:hypothetical protein